MEVTFIKATTLPDLWYRLIWGLIRESNAPGRHIYEIDRGSYVGQKRIGYNYLIAQIDHPSARPLIPEIPPHLNIPPPVESMEYIDNYFSQYLMNPEIEDNEVYKYATWLAPGVERVIEQLKGAPGNNQATISIGGWAPEREGTLIHSDGPDGDQSTVGRFVDTDNFIDPGTGQRDPACLRVCDFRLDQNNTLHLITYWRSWDVHNGLPSNLAGLELVLEFVAEALDAKVGKMIVSSKGAHIYTHAIQVAAERLGMTNVGTIDDLLNYWDKNSE